tara:strand:+ start:1904 stop:2176 length:273 start_codon:yes stop_codon:yes gene_type:complete
MEGSQKRFINVGDGTLFRASESSNPKAPPYTGKITVDGKEFELAAWVRESKKDGKKFFSLTVTKVEELESPSTSGNYSPRPAVTDEEIPF